MKILVGKVLKPQGIKGEVKMSCLLDNPKQFNTIKVMYLGERELKVRSIRSQSVYVFVQFCDIIDRNNAQTLVNWDVYADKSDIVVPQDSFFICDLIGSMVYLDDGTYLGSLENVTYGGGADIFDVRGEKNVQFPFITDLIVNIDVENKKIILLSKRFNEVCLYED